MQPPEFSLKIASLKLFSKFYNNNNVKIKVCNRQLCKVNMAVTKNNIKAIKFLKVKSIP